MNVLRLRGLGLHSLEERMGNLLEKPVLIVLAVGLVVGIPVMVLGQVSADDTRARTRAAQLEAASDAAVRGSEALGLRLTNLREVLQFYAGNFEFQNAVWERSETFLRSRHTEMAGALGAEVATLAITDEKGVILQGALSGNVATHEYFQRARRDATELRSTRAVVEIVDVPSSESQRLAVAAPIRRAATNFIGVLVAEVRLRDVAEWIQSQLGSSEDLLLIDARTAL